MKNAVNVLTPQLAFEYFKVAGKGTTEEKANLWKKIAAQVGGKADFESLCHIYLQIFASEEVPIAWVPDESTVERSNIARLMHGLDIPTYKKLHQWSVENREAFWERTINFLDIKFSKPFTKVMDLSKGVENPEWLSGATLNIVESCLQGRKEQDAIVYALEGAANIERVTYEALGKKVKQFASGLESVGFQKGDRIVLYIPLCMEAVVAYLGIIKAGMVVVSVADSFSATELRKRIEMTDASGVVCCDGYTYGGRYLDVISRVREAVPEKLIFCRLAGEDEKKSGEMYFEELLGNDAFQAVEAKPDDLINILFSSGTTKEPKAIPWTHLTPIKCASDGFYHQDIKPEDVVTWTTGMGWMMAPWLIFATLINKATMAIYTGAATGEDYASFVKEARVSVLGTIPSVVKAWRAKDFHKKVDWKVRLWSSTGEPSNPEDYFYLMYLSGFKAPIVEYCGGTEIGGAYITGTVVQPASPSVFTTPALGLDFYLLDQQGKPVGEGVAGEVFIVPPSIGLTQKLLNRDHHEEYYQHVPAGPNGEALRKHGDAFEVHEEMGVEFFKSSGRVDDAMNLGGIKISAVEIEEVLNKHEDVFECAAVAIAGAGGGPEKLVVYVKPLVKNIDLNILKKEMQDKLSKELNPLFRIFDVVKTENLPRTASNKLMRRVLRNRYLDRQK
ncbi:AMP-binding protein [Cytophagaceae bacterium ABcell3]|nr:AMP-binding protein [Cytophagaceae bacterium ABcell3]